MKLCIIGTGKMGSALAEGLAKGGAIPPKSIVLVDSSFKKAKEVARKIGASASNNAHNATQKSDVIILAVKPAAVEGALAQLGQSLAGKLLVSIAAGIPSRFIEKRVPASCRVALAMPNIAMQAGFGMCCYVPGRRCGARDSKLLHTLLSSTGFAERLSSESEIDSAFISASGIAFFFMAIDSLAKAAQQNGMERKQALRISSAAAYGAGAIAISGREPADLEAMVATKKGITLEGLKLLRRQKVPQAFLSAAKKCIARAKLLRKSR